MTPSRGRPLLCPAGHALTSQFRELLPPSPLPVIAPAPFVAFYSVHTLPLVLATSGGWLISELPFRRPPRHAAAAKRGVHSQANRPSRVVREPTRDDNGSLGRNGIVYRSRRMGQIQIMQIVQMMCCVGKFGGMGVLSDGRILQRMEWITRMHTPMLGLQVLCWK